MPSAKSMDLKLAFIAQQRLLLSLGARINGMDETFLILKL